MPSSGPGTGVGHQFIAPAHAVSCFCYPCGKIVTFAKQACSVDVAFRETFGAMVARVSIALLLGAVFFRNDERGDLLLLVVVVEGVNEKRRK